MMTRRDSGEGGRRIRAYGVGNPGSHDDVASILYNASAQLTAAAFTSTDQDVIASCPDDFKDFENSFPKKKEFENSSCRDRRGTATASGTSLRSRSPRALW